MTTVSEALATGYVADSRDLNLIEVAGIVGLGLSEVKALHCAGEFDCPPVYFKSGKYRRAVSRSGLADFQQRQGKK